MGILVTEVPEVNNEAPIHVKTMSKFKVAIGIDFDVNHSLEKHARTTTIGRRQRRMRNLKARCCMKTTKTQLALGLVQRRGLCL